MPNKGPRAQVPKGPIAQRPKCPKSVPKGTKTNENKKRPKKTKKEVNVFFIKNKDLNDEGRIKRPA